VLGRDAHDVVGIWQHVYDRQLVSHGLGAATCIGLSGIDMALWDIRGKATGLPLHRLLGGASRAIPAYAGGLSLGYQPPDALVAEARLHLDAGYRAVKLRIGDTVKNDVARIAAVRRAFGDDLVILTDANTGYDVAMARAAIPRFDELASAGSRNPSRRTTTAATNSRRASASCRSRPARTTTRASSSSTCSRRVP
jgi:D-galactarolactone cycloisomerase